MNKTRSVNRYIGLSIILHTLICVFLFLAIIHKQLPQAAHMHPANKPIQIPAPVKFIQQPPTPAKIDTSPLDIDPPGMPKGLAMSMSQLPEESLLANKKPGLTQEKNQPIPTIKQEAIATQQEQTSAVPEKQQATPRTALPDKKKSTALENKFLTKTADTGIPVPKELTLADLFKNAHQALGQESKQVMAQDAGGPSGDIVISEGSLKYYSLWSKFLSHLNDAARFNRRGGKDREVHQWLHAGLIKKEALFAIDIATNGQVVNVALLSSSGHPPFDTLCITDIWSAAPYPPLPASINRPTARFQVKAFF